MLSSKHMITMAKKWIQMQTTISNITIKIKGMENMIKMHSITKDMMKIMLINTMETMGITQTMVLKHMDRMVKTIKTMTKMIITTNMIPMQE